MNRHFTRDAARLAGPLAGLVLSAAIGVAPALAAPAPNSRAGTAGAAQTEQVVGQIQCAEAWRTARAEPTVANYRAVGLCEIDRRLATIDRLGNGIEIARALTDDHQAALQRILDSSAAGLRTLRAEIEADTTVAELRKDISRIFEDFRIYALVTPQVGLVIAADRVDSAGAALDDTAADLATLIARAEAAGKDVTEAKAHLAAMQTAIDKAVAGVDGVAGKILPLTPADWNAGRAGPIMREARQVIAGARADLRTAMAEARQVIAALA